MNATREASRPTPGTTSCLKPLSAALAGAGFVATLLVPAPYAVAAEVTPAVFARETVRDPWQMAQAAPATSLNDSAAIGVRSLLAQAKATTTYTVTNTNATGAGSLSDAITSANTFGCYGNDSIINFNIAGPAPHVIFTNAGFSIDCPTVINGYSQPDSSPNSIADARNGSNAVPTIVIDAFNMSVGNLLTIQPAASATQIRGLVLRNWPSNSFAVFNQGPSTQVAGNFIGVDETGSACATEPTSNGVFSAGSGTIGGPNPSDRNIVGCASWTGGVVLNGSGNVVKGNLIGVSKNGLSPLGNNNGVVVNGFGNTVGGQGVGEGNVIARNSGQGVTYSNSATAVISGNDIFLNGLSGIDTTNLSYSPPNLTIGGVTYSVAGTTITGTTEVFTNFTTGLEFFDNDTSLVGLDFSEGARYMGLGAASVAGAATPFTVTIAAPVRNPTATATKLGSTTVFSAPFLTPDMQAQDVSFAPVSSLTFPAASLGASSGPVTLRIKNTGQANLVIDSITNSNPAEFFDSTTPAPPNPAHYCGLGSDSTGAPLTGTAATVAPGGECTMNLVFKPTVSGARSGTLTINDAQSPNYSLAVSLAGTGGTVTPLPTSVTFSPTSLTLPGPVPLFSTLNVNVVNPNLAPASSLAYSQTLPSGLVIAATPNATVTGTLCSFASASAIAGAGSFSFSGISVPAGGGACDVKVDVTSSVQGVYPVTVGTTSMSGLIISEPVGSATSTGNLAVNAAALAISPPSPVNFGTVTLGSSAPIAVTLTNTGGAPINFSAPFAITGPNAGEFSFTDTCVPDPLPQLAPGGSCTVNLTFAPTALGTLSAAMNFASNTLTTPDVLNLTGIGSTLPVPIVSLSPTGLFFPAQTVGTTSSPQTATLANIGTAPLAITSIITTGDFAQSSTCGTSVSPSASCTISVTFSPVIAGLRTGDVKITSNASGSPHAIALDGDGVAPLVPTITAPTSVSFPTTQVGSASSPVSVTIGNTGGSPLVVSTVEIVGSGFVKGADGCAGASVPPGSNCVITLTFVPTASGVNSATLRLLSNAPTSPTLVGLSGSGSALPVGNLAASPTSLTFGTQTLSTTSAGQAIAVTNTGSATVTVSSVAVSGDFAQTHNCSSIPASGSCTVTVTFTPAIAGSRTGAVTIASDASNSPLSVGLTGTGAPVAAPVIELSASSLSYGNTLIGGGATQAITLRNIGGAPLTISSLRVTGEFPVSSGCPAVVAAGESCRLDVGFRPTIPGLRSGRLDVLSNASNGTKGADLAGTGCRFSFLNRSLTFMCQ